MFYSNYNPIFGPSKEVSGSWENRAKMAPLDLKIKEVEFSTHPIFTVIPIPALKVAVR